MVDNQRLLAIGLSTLMILSVCGIGTAIAATDLALSGSGGSATPGSTVAISLTLENGGNSTASGPAVELTDLPSGWSIDSVSTDGGTSNSDNTQVLYLSVSGGSSVNPTWTVSVPSNVSTGEYQLTGKVLSGGSVTDSVNVTVTIKQSLELSGSGDKTTVEKATNPNAPPSLSFTVTNNANSAVSAPSINITDYPDGWNITNPGGDGTWGQSDEAFIYIDVGAGMTQTSTFQFEAPDDVSNGTYTVTAELVRNGSTVDTVTVDVTLTGTLDEAYDQDGDNQVDEIGEVQGAIGDFSKGDLTISEVQELIRKWAQAN